MEIRVDAAPGLPEPAVFAAGELAAYLNRMLEGEEGTLSVALEVRPGHEAGSPDWFSVEMGADGGTVAGNSGRGVLLGVYDYLRRLGCRFLAPVEGCEAVPAIRRRALPMAYEHRASFYHRGVCIEGADSRENVLDFIDWLPKVGYNSFFLQFKSPYAFLKRWYSHEKNPLREPEEYTWEDAEAAMAALEEAVKKRGLLLHKAGHGWTGEVLGCRTASWDAQGQELGPAVRHRAAEVGGVRGLYKGVPANTNLCYHDADAVDAFAALVADYAEKNPHVDYLHVWLADEYNNVCECEACRKTTVSDQYVELLNEIDRRLAARGLGTKVVFLLYQELLWPPVRARLHHPDRFVLMFAPISRTFEQSYRPGGRLPGLPPYERNHIELPAGLEENLAFLRGWQAQFGGDSFVYDYPLGRAHYGDFGYIKLSRVVSGDVKQLRQLGLNGYISCQELRAGLPNFLPNYVLGRMLMDEGSDVDALVGEYCRAAYGRDWAVAAGYLSRLSALGSADYINGRGPRRNGEVAARMEAVQALCLDFAPVLDARRAGGGRFALFWAVLGIHREYVLKLSRALMYLARGNMAQAWEEWRAFRQFICEKEPDFQPWLDVYRVLEVTEKYTGFRQAAEA